MYVIVWTDWKLLHVRFAAETQQEEIVEAVLEANADIHAQTCDTRLVNPKWLSLSLSLSLS